VAAKETRKKGDATDVNGSSRGAKQPSHGLGSASVCRGLAARKVTNVHAATRTEGTAVKPVDHVRKVSAMTAALAPCVQATNSLPTQDARKGFAPALDAARQGHGLDESRVRCQCVRVTPMGH
jgi:hypothetical protein